MSWPSIVGIAAVVVIAAFFMWLSNSTRRQIARQLDRLAILPCRSCGVPYGKSTSEEARRAYLQNCRAYAQQRPDLRINFDRRWPVRCSRCGAEAQFQFERGQLEPVLAKSLPGAQVETRT